MLTDFCVLHTGVFVNDIHALPTLGILYNTTLSCYHSSLDKHVNHGPGPGFVFEGVPPEASHTAGMDTGNSNLF